MPILSLTDIVDLFSKAGTPKVTKVKEIKHRAPYQPATDYYRRFREGVITIHEENKPKDALSDILNFLPSHKEENYSEVVEGYRKWWGRKNFEWFEPPRSVYSFANFSISVNPELGLVIDGQSYVIKLYIKAESLAKVRVDLITSMMELVFSNVHPDFKLAVLDVRNSKLFVSNGPLRDAEGVINAELSYVEALWPYV